MIGENGRQPRTVLERCIRQRRQTLDEFAAYAEAFARDHGERGTLSRRHLDRLVAGKRADGTLLGRPNPATARLLERIFGITVDTLLSEPASSVRRLDDERQLRERLNAASRVDASLLNLLQDQLTATRRLDRQLGAVIAHDEVLAKIGQVSGLLTHSLMPARRARLAALLAELHTLAGWQALDMAQLTDSWQHYEHAKTAAHEANDPAITAHTRAEQAFVLVDLDDASAAVDLLTTTRANAAPHADPLLGSWLAAAHGETLAAHGDRSASLQAFDDATALLPTEPGASGRPYLALDSVHLARWRGHALARIGEPEAIDVLTHALDRLDPTFTRAATAMHVDLAIAYTWRRERDAAEAHKTKATAMASTIGSTRQHRRMSKLRNN
ncbi:MAG: hypothetical protein ACRDRL_29550 [Sciscionella sp.]